MSGRFEGNFDRIERAIESALNPTAIAFAKAANQYVKKDTGATEASVWVDSDFKRKTGMGYRVCWVRIL